MHLTIARRRRFAAHLTRLIYTTYATVKRGKTRARSRHIALERV